MNDIFKNSQPLVEIKNLYAGYQYEVVLEDINLTIEQDDFIGLIGPNGGGKTTLLRVLLGLLQPKSGSITVMGETPEKGRRRIGYVPQFAEYDAEFPISVRDVVRMGRLSSQRLFKPYSTEDDRVVDERLDWVGMLEYQDRAIRELSGGQRQRVYIARALTTNPHCLFWMNPPSVWISKPAPKFTSCCIRSTRTA